MPGFQTAYMPRPSAQGESKKVMRWDLMRPVKLAAPRPPPQPPRPVRTDPSPSEIPAELQSLVRRNGGPKIRRKLLTDYERRHDLVHLKAPFIARLWAGALGHKYGFPAYLIFGETQIKQVVLARHELCWRLYRYGKQTGRHHVFTLSNIAKWLHRKDHTTAMHGVQQTEKRRRAAA